MLKVVYKNGCDVLPGEPDYEYNDESNKLIVTYPESGIKKTYDNGNVIN